MVQMPALSRGRGLYPPSVWVSPTHWGFFIWGVPMPDRAVLFVDGNNWYHALKDGGVRDQARLNHAAIAAKLCGPRDWIATRYYIGRVPQTGDTTLYAEQRRFMAKLEATDSRIKVHYGRIEQRPYVNEAARELRRYLADLTTSIDKTVYRELSELAKKHDQGSYMVEKAVDVMLAVDLVVMAERNEFDTAYILSADGDYTHAVQVARAKGKKVFAASVNHGAQLAAAVDCYIPLKPAWFNDCYSEELSEPTGTKKSALHPKRAATRTQPEIIMKRR